MAGVMADVMTGGRTAVGAVRGSVRDGVAGRARAALGNERGDLVASLVGSVLMMLVLGAVVVGMVTTGQFQGNISGKTEVTGQLASAESAFRSDVRWASAVTPGDVDPGSSVEFTVPGRGGTCRESEWAFTGGELVNTVTNFSAYDASGGSVRCSGSRSSSTSQVMVGQAGDVSEFAYFNAGGRLFTDPAGGVLAAGSAPAGVPVSAWESTSVNAVGFDLFAGVGDEFETSAPVYQVALMVPSSGVPDMASVFVGHTVME